jgi:hypothetical protein
MLISIIQEREGFDYDEFLLSTPGDKNAAIQSTKNGTS